MAGESHEQQKNMGWKDIKETNNHEWTTMVQRIQKHIQMLNQGSEDWIKDVNCKYYNSLARLKDRHTIELTDQNGNKEIVTSKYIFISVGGRPTYLDNIPDIKNLVITSDDIFSLKNPPGKTLVVGASYIALECAGFLNGLNQPVTVMVRSIFLRGFDQEMANEIANYMERHGVRFIREAIPLDIKLEEGNKKRVFWKNQQGQEQSELFDTVMLAIGRSADTNNIGLEEVGVKKAKNGKIICSEKDQTSVENIYAVGDCVEGRPELTPTAINAAKIVIKNLFNNENKSMDYKNVATTVFTPLEYGCIGYSEEQAREKLGNENIKVYYSSFNPLEWTFSDKKKQDKVFCKLIVDVKDNQRVVGFHYLGPNAGEVTQGFAIAFKAGATKQHFDETVGIHPTCAEEYTSMRSAREPKL